MFPRIMSFGRPPSINLGFKPTPPERGSFPLDHYGQFEHLVLIVVFIMYPSRMQRSYDAVHEMSQ